MTCVLGTVVGSFVSMCAVHACEDMDPREKKVPRASSSAWRVHPVQFQRSRSGTRIRGHRGGTIKTPQTQHPQWVLESSVSFRTPFWQRKVGPRPSRLERLSSFAVTFLEVGRGRLPRTQIVSPEKHVKSGSFPWGHLGASWGHLKAS